MSTTTQDTEQNIPPFFFELPDGFHPLPLDTAAEGEERREALGRLVREIYPNGDDRIWNGFAPVYDGVTDAMLGAGLEFAAMGFFDTGSGGVAQCSFTIAVVPSQHASPEIAANGIQEVLTRTATGVDVLRLDLACGPAVAGISVQEVTFNGAYTATGKDAPLRMGRLQAYVPFPNGPCLAVLTLETAAMEYWENFSVMLGTVLKSVAFPTVEAHAAGEAAGTTPPGQA
ncbi:hypothetical protein ACIOC1_28395 [Streptomyces sp. NPDC088197]|uniref:hypothetical protein n=1 Tax=Streptomyces sp. NPDC088197 TaxID=3365840 RepID=UPI00380E0D16